MQKILLTLIILAITACGNHKYVTDDFNNYGPNPQYDYTDDTDDTNTYDYGYDSPVEEDGIKTIDDQEKSQFDKDAEKVSRELEELSREREKQKVYKKLVPSTHDDAFHN